MHNQNSTNEKAAEGATLTSTLVEQQQNHPLLMPSLVCNEVLRNLYITKKSKNNRIEIIIRSRYRNGQFIFHNKNLK